jgi:hypothetical protein
VGSESGFMFLNGVEGFVVFERLSCECTIRSDDCVALREVRKE